MKQQLLVDLRIIARGVSKNIRTSWDEGISWLCRRRHQSASQYPNWSTTVTSSKYPLLVGSISTAFWVDNPEI